VQENNGKAIASLVLGILAVICVVFGQGGAAVGIILGIVGLILGINAKKESDQNAGMATAGIVLSIIAIAICVLALVACLACMGCLLASTTYY